MDLGLDSINGVGGIDIEGDGLASQGQKLPVPFTSSYPNRSRVSLNHKGVVLE